MPLTPMRSTSLLLALLGCACATVRTTTRPAEARLILRPLCTSTSTFDAKALEVEWASQSVRAYRLDDASFGASKLSSFVDLESLRASGPLRTSTANGGLEVHLQQGGTFTYTVRASTASLYGLRSDHTGIGGLAPFFVMRPLAEAPGDVDVSWDTSRCGPLETFGGGSTSFEALEQRVLLAGRPRVASRGRVRVALFGDVKLDEAELAAFGAQAWDAEREFFDDDDPVPIELFVRAVPEHRGRSNGMAQPHSLLLAVGPDMTLGTRVKVNIGHELLHHWLGLRLRFAGPEGEHFWFTEGFTVYFSTKLLAAHRLLSAEEAQAEAQKVHTRHESNPRRSASNEAIREHFDDDPELSLLPYTRGALYAEELDGQLHGGLSELVLQLEREARSEGPLPLQRFLELLRTRLGPDALVRFHDVIIAGVAQPD